ncbi:sigma-70 family RNA polymerase sigma factor [Kaustia mangrovi]|uniref:RNA polymerase sigma factor n=1 Tax=Kaustia mangrovi TaxID=2593653 RepID=A0A7S8C196_9HYPH|nr:sigma-70 family RNA polymerase sigma factor [Kaustia mangrovi]QPC41501.1 sigma-70 family RNA polymerase sigma factor [Kaustia mangrovi]
MTVSASLRKDLLEQIPNLRAFAHSLCGNGDEADDLVQETLMRAWANLASFREGTNLRAWLFTILRNAFYSSRRRRRNETSDYDGQAADRLVVLPSQDRHMDLEDFRKALAGIPEEQREALILIGASGFSYEEAAGICGCAIGTVKSRVSRARRRLAELLSMEEGGDFGPSSAAETVGEPAVTGDLAVHLRK